MIAVCICNKEFEDTTVGNRIKRKFCSDSCKYRSWREAKKADPVRLAKDKENRNKANKRYFNTKEGREKKLHRSACNEGLNVVTHGKSRRWRLAEAKLLKSSKGTKGSSLWFVGECLTCGSSFCGVGPGSASPENLTSAYLKLAPKYCSGSCASSASSRVRRVRRRGNYAERVDKFKVFERDNWICQLCKDPIDPTVKYPDNFSPSIDHIIPIAMGGAHDMENCQSAHMICNSKKHDRIYL